MGLMDSQNQQDVVWMMDGDLMPGAESVTYTKRNGATRSITAMVDRLARINEDGVTVHDILVRVANDSTYGIAASEIDFDGDTITVDLDLTGAARAYRVRRPGQSGTVLDRAELVLQLT